MNFNIRKTLLIFVIQMSTLSAGQVFSTGKNLSCDVCDGAINVKKTTSGLSCFHDCGRTICENCDGYRVAHDHLRSCEFCNKNLDEERLKMLMMAFNVDNKDNLDQDHKDLVREFACEMKERCCIKNVIGVCDENFVEECEVLAPFDLMMNSYTCYFLAQKCAKKRMATKKK